MHVLCLLYTSKYLEGLVPCRVLNITTVVLYAMCCEWINEHFQIHIFVIKDKSTHILIKEVMTIKTC